MSKIKQKLVPSIVSVIMSLNPYIRHAVVLNVTGCTHLNPNKGDSGCAPISDSEAAFDIAGALNDSSVSDDVVMSLYGDMDVLARIPAAFMDSHVSVESIEYGKYTFVTEEIDCMVVGLTLYTESVEAFSFRKGVTLEGLLTRNDVTFSIDYYKAS